MNDVALDQEEVHRLVWASRAGDQAAFDRLVLLHQRQALGLALGTLENRDDAAEVVQEAFLKAHLGLGGLSQPGRFRFWLLKIVANEAVSWRRTARRRRIMTRLFVPAPGPKGRGAAGLRVGGGASGEAVAGAAGERECERTSGGD